MCTCRQSWPTPRQMTRQTGTVHTSRSPMERFEPLHTNPCSCDNGRINGKVCGICGGTGTVPISAAKGRIGDVPEDLADE